MGSIKEIMSFDYWNWDMTDKVWTFLKSVQMTSLVIASNSIKIVIKNEKQFQCLSTSRRISQWSCLPSGAIHPSISLQNLNLVRTKAFQNPNRYCFRKKDFEAHVIRMPDLFLRRRRPRRDVPAFAKKKSTRVWRCPFHFPAPAANFNWLPSTFTELKTWSWWEKILSLGV